MNKMLEEVFETKRVSVAFTNTIACTPWDEDKITIGKPTTQQIKNCSPRLKEFIGIAKPKQLIAVGKPAEKALKLLKLEYFSIVHPGYMLRRGGLKSIEYIRTVLQLRDLLSQKHHA